MTRREHEQRFREAAGDLRPLFWRLAGAFADDAEREDLVQEMLVQVWLALPRFRGQAKLSTWAYRVALNTALGWRRRAARRPERAEMPVEEAAARGDPLEARDQVARVYAVLRTLPEPDRVVLLLALEERTGAEMAALLDISENTALVRLHRARKRLAKALGEEVRQ